MLVFLIAILLYTVDLYFHIDYSVTLRDEIKTKYIERNYICNETYNKKEAKADVNIFNDFRPYKLIIYEGESREDKNDAIDYNINLFSCAVNELHTQTNIATFILHINESINAFFRFDSYDERLFEYYVKELYLKLMTNNSYENSKLQDNQYTCNYKNELKDIIFLTILLTILSNQYINDTQKESLLISILTN